MTQNIISQNHNQTQESNINLNHTASNPLMMRDVGQRTQSEVYASQQYQQRRGSQQSHLMIFDDGSELNIDNNRTIDQYQNERGEKDIQMMDKTM